MLNLSIGELPKPDLHLEEGFAIISSNEPVAVVHDATPVQAHLGKSVLLVLTCLPSKATQDSTTGLPLNLGATRVESGFGRLGAPSPLLHLALALWPPRTAYAPQKLTIQPNPLKEPQHLLPLCHLRKLDITPGTRLLLLLAVWWVSSCKLCRLVGRVFFVYFRTGTGVVLERLCYVRFDRGQHLGVHLGV